MTAVSPTRPSGAQHLVPEQVEVSEQVEHLRRLLQESAAEKRALLLRLADVEGEEPLVAAARDALDDVEGALVRLDAGTHGSCEACARPIPWPRLEAVPDARFCIDCTKPRGVLR